MAKGKVEFVKFTAPWCGPCHDMDPIIRSVLRDFPKVEYVKVNVDTKAGSATADAERVQSIPTMLIRIDGEKVWRRSGAVSEKVLRSAFEDHASN